MYSPFQVLLETAASAAATRSIVFHERMEVIAAKIVDVAGIAADSTNYATFQVLGNDQTDVLFQWDTRAANQGALTALTSADLVSQGNEPKAVFEAGSTLVVKVLKNSSGKATNANICILLRQARNV